MRGQLYSGIVVLQPVDREGLAEHLVFLAGKTHYLRGTTDPGDQPYVIPGRDGIIIAGGRHPGLQQEGIESAGWYLQGVIGDDAVLGADVGYPAVLDRKSVV